MTTPPAEPSRLYEDRTVARSPDGIRSLMYACVTGVMAANTRAHTPISASAATKFRERPIRASAAALVVAPASRSVVRRLNTLGAWGTSQPPAIMAPATMAAAHPAVE